MAYTYEDFTTAANRAGMLNRFSQNDLDTAMRSPEYGLSMLRLMQDVNSAGTAEQRLVATEAANQLRKNYGVSSPVSISSGVTTPRVSQTVDVQSGNAGGGVKAPSSFGQGITGGSYPVTSGGDMIKGTAQDILGSLARGNGTNGYAGGGTAYQNVINEAAQRQGFEYDLEADPVYSAYRKQYLREGDRAYQNAIAQAAASSGGVPSSYALGAAQQAQNYYNAQLTDMIPTLEENAYQRYLNDFNNALTLYKTLGYVSPEDAKLLGIAPTAASGGGTAGGLIGGITFGDKLGTGSEANTNDETGETGSNGNDYPVDMDSVLQLGYGPINAAGLDGLIASGKVEEYLENGMYKYRKVENPFAKDNILNKYWPWNVSLSK